MPSIPAQPCGATSPLGFARLNLLHLRGKKKPWVVARGGIHGTAALSSSSSPAAAGRRGGDSSSHSSRERERSCPEASTRTPTSSGE
ncbi:uncharacterized protein K489DRAFT_383980 [Dissoconium aciculare CBS 342.82]|uniref:Uncharacterized protein n=1 Tax=Dissoconium aciculare CBS 342.82 TaxID=1314786 RepID=A0A6J3LTX4_9PEZI|nr:uncharacterized protein K489DRAFT_383980 [Dissoconium aciculare CBS 342.82]KAF1819083.1 hypothetical protein K489DRAFT_383980 [Dissoconium aciculare CBS 342.82]